MTDGRAEQTAGRNAEVLPGLGYVPCWPGWAPQSWWWLLLDVYVTPRRKRSGGTA